MTLLRHLPRRKLAAALLYAGLLCGPALAYAQGGELVPVRIGQHGDYTRVVLDFPKLTAYSAESVNGDARLTFDTPLQVVPLRGATGLVRKMETARDGNNSLAVTLDLPDGATYKHYRLLRKVVIDVYPPGAAPKVSAPKTAQAPPKAAPAPAPAPAAAAKPAPAPQPAPATPMTEAPLPVPAAAEAPKAAAPDLAAVQQALGAAPGAATQIVADAMAPTAAPTQEELAAPTTIKISTVQPTRMAVFPRFDTLWVVMDSESASAALPEVRGPLQSALGAPKVMKFEGGTAYRYALPQPQRIAISRRSLVWEITMGRDVTRPPTPAQLNVAYDEASRKSKLMAQLKDTGPVLTLEDPAIGDTLYVVPTGNTAQRIDQARVFPDLEILPAELGMALRPVADGLRATRLGDVISITAPAGIQATPGATATPSLTSDGTAMADDTRRLFDFPSWSQGGVTRLHDNRAAYEAAAAAAATPDARAEALLKLALLYFANNFGHETLGVLRIITEENPDMGKNPNIIALRGAAAAMAGQYDDALKDLSHPAIQQHPEVNLWIGYAAAATEQWRMANRAFPNNNALLAEYPASIAVPFTIYMAESALRLGQTDTARALLSSLDGLHDDAAGDPHHVAAIDYLSGEAARQEGRFDEAIEIWTRVANSLDRLYHTKASLALTNLQLQEKRIPIQDAIDAVDSLRFAWRGDGLEVQILNSLGKMKVANGQYLSGLQDMKTAAALADGLRDDSSVIRNEMTRILGNLFSDGSTAKITPLEAVTVYTEFESLMPQGPSGTEAALNFAESLIDMDLLDRAALLIQKQFDASVVPLERAEIGAKLASVYLLDSRPALALDALLRSETGGMPESLAQRRTLLKARAQSQLNLTAEASATLAGLSTPDAQKLKADMLWRGRKWGEAAAAIEALVPAPDNLPKPLDAETARMITNAAVGYKLAGDAARLEYIKNRYGSAMAATPMAQTFNVVTRDGGINALSDRDTILKIAGEVDMFKGFLDSYKARVSGDNGG